MIKSIQQFQSEGVKKLDKIFNDYSKDLSKVAEMVKGVTDSVVSLGLSMIAEEWEFYDETLRNRRDLRPDWYIVRTDETTKLTSLGEVKYHKTLFRNRKSGKNCYLLDKIIGFAPNERLTEDAVARILDEAADSSYRKGGLNVSISGEMVSKETAMNKIHPLQFPPVRPGEELRQVKTLYIDADEVHVSLQYLDKKGDTKDKRSNTFMPKLVYVYEGIDDESHSLINVKYFGGGYEGPEGVQKLWKEVYGYIWSADDDEVLERIYVNGDGAEWIKTGARMHGRAKFVLDKYHLNKYIVAATSHLKDSAEDARSEIWRAINRVCKADVNKAFDRIEAVTESESKLKTVEDSRKYILGQWSGIRQGVRNRKDNCHCSAEGHISHIYADRMSSRPLGWSVIGADKIARLRIYKKNGGRMLDLVRYQKEELKMAVGAEEQIYSCEAMLRMEAKNRRRLGNMADTPIYSIPYSNVKKVMQFKTGLHDL